MAGHLWAEGQQEEEKEEEDEEEDTGVAPGLGTLR